MSKPRHEPTILTAVPACSTDNHSRFLEPPMAGRTGGVSTPPGRIRPRSVNRVRPPSAGFQDIGFFSAHTPGHLTSSSRRPVSPAVQHGLAIAPFGTNLEHARDAATLSQRIDLAAVLLAEQQTKAAYAAMLSLSSRSKSELRELLEQGLILLGALPEGLAVEVCAAASENQDNNVIASIMCSEFKSKQLEGKLEMHRANRQLDEDRRAFHASLESLIANGANLLEQVDNKMVRLVALA